MVDETTPRPGRLSYLRMPLPLYFNLTSCWDPEDGLEGSLGLSVPGVATLNRSPFSAIPRHYLSNRPVEDWWPSLADSALTVSAPGTGLLRAPGEAPSCSLHWRREFLLLSWVWRVSPSCLSSLWPEGQQLPPLATGSVLGPESPLPSRLLSGSLLCRFLAG